MDINYNNDVIEIDIMDLMKLWLRKAWLIALAAILCAIIMFGYSKANLKMVYQSSGRILVINQREELTSDSQVTTNANLTDDYIEVIKSRTVVNQVIDNLGLSASYEQIVGKIAVSRLDDTRILVVSVSDMDGGIVKELVDELLRVSAKHMEAFLEVYAVKIMDEGGNPQGFPTINIKKNTILALFAGAFLVVFVLTFYYLMDETLENAEQVKRKLHCETLGVINSEKEDLESFEALRTNIKMCVDKLQTLVISNCNEKQDTYTLAYKLAGSFAKNDKKVLFVDANMRYEKQENLKLGLCEALENGKELSEIVMKTDISDLFLVHAGNQCRRPSELLDSERFDEFLKKAKSEYDIVIFTTPAMGKYIDAVVVAKRCDATVMVVERKQTSYKKLQSAIKQLVFVKANIIGCVIRAKKV